MTIDKSLKATIIVALLIISVSLFYFLVLVPQRAHQEELAQQAKAEQEAKVAAVKDRDKTRLQHIDAFQIGLELYKDAKGVYPKSLEEADAAEYMGPIKKNPTPDANGVCASSTAYQYTLRPDGGYDIAFCLEVGTSEYNPGNRVVTEGATR